MTGRFGLALALTLMTTPPALAQSSWAPIAGREAENQTLMLARLMTQHSVERQAEIFYDERLRLDGWWVNAQDWSWGEARRQKAGLNRNENDVSLAYLDALRRTVEGCLDAPTRARLGQAAYEEASGFITQLNFQAAQRARADIERLCPALQKVAELAALREADQAFAFVLYRFEMTQLPDWRLDRVMARRPQARLAFEWARSMTPQALAEVRALARAAYRRDPNADPNALETALASPPSDFMDMLTGGLTVLAMRHLGTAQLQAGTRQAWMDFAGRPDVSTFLVRASERAVGLAQAQVRGDGLTQELDLLDEAAIQGFAALP